MMQGTPLDSTVNSLLLCKDILYGVDVLFGAFNLLGLVSFNYAQNVGNRCVYLKLCYVNKIGLDFLCLFSGDS